MDLDILPRLPHDRQIGIGCIGAGFIMADCHLVAYRGRLEAVGDYGS
jgi:predicted dehydrogenase